MQEAALVGEELEELSGWAAGGYGGAGEVGGDGLEGVAFEFVVVDGLVGDEVAPGDAEAVEAPVAEFGGRVDLGPVGVDGAPEDGPPLVVEGGEVGVAVAEVAAEVFAAELAVAFAGELVGDVPEKGGGVPAVALGEAAVDGGDFFAEDGRGGAVVMASAMEVALAAFADAEDFRVALGEPGGGGRQRGWRRRF